MLTKLRIRNFKRLEDVEINLGNPVVFVGPNNSGKTTALQALSLWDVGRRKWAAKRSERKSPTKRPGVTINRKDLLAAPVPVAELLWSGLHVRESQRSNGKTKTKNIRIDIEVSGVTDNNEWTCGFEFDYGNVESIYCRPLRLPGYDDEPVDKAKLSEVSDLTRHIRIAFLPPMSGLAAEEPKIEPGRIDVLLGQGQTAQVLRNICYENYVDDAKGWSEVTKIVEDLFGVKLLPPVFLTERGEVTMEYEERGVRLDISAAGRGLQQTLLILTFLFRNPDTVLLLDEPDAHLEILRQREMFNVITEQADLKRCQIVAASHSEVILNEAASSSTVIAFVGKPHPMNDRPTQVLKSLCDIGWEDYFQAEETGWVLYLEDETDLSILRRFAQLLQHPAEVVLQRPFFHRVTTNVPQRARDHFYGLREARPDLIGIAIFDRINKELHTGCPIVELAWRRREIENYLCQREVLIRFARGAGQPDLFTGPQVEAMSEEIAKLEDAFRVVRRPEPWSHDIKASDEFLDPLFKNYYARLQLPLEFRKRDYCHLVGFLDPNEVDPEIGEKLDAILAVAKQARTAL